MELVCPDPVVYSFWQAAMAQAGIALLVSVALFAVMVWAARPEGCSLRARCGSYVALALGAAYVVFSIHARLDDLAALIARFYRLFPQSCAFNPGLHNAPELNTVVAPAFQQVAPTEWAAAIMMAVAVVAVAALGSCVVALARATRRRDLASPMTSVIADS